MRKIAEKYLGANRQVKYSLMDYYNLNCYQYVSPNRRYRIQRNDEWCAMFTSVIAHKAGISSEQFPYEVSVFYQYKWARDKGLFYTTPTMVTPNDLIIYDWRANGTFDHVGIVIERKGGYIKVIEGNRGDTVAYRTISENSKSIKGYIKIYAKSKDEVAKDNAIIDRLAKEVIAGKHGNGLERIKSLGDHHLDVQRRVNELLNK